MIKDYNIYVKLTNGCNLKCKHCYNEIMNNHLPMSDKTLNKTIAWIKGFREKHPLDTLNMSLHGGEPMLYNLDKIIYLLDSTEDLNLKWCVTTNLQYALTDKHFEIFERMKPFDEKPLIMTSYDFGDTRFTNASQETLWRENVQKCLDKGIDVQPIICVTKYLVENVSPQEVIDFVRNIGLNRFNFERITETGRASQNPIKPLNRKADEWLLNAYKVYESLDMICPLFEGVEKSIDGIFLGCRERKCMDKVITINPDGKIASCPNMADNCYGTLDKEDIYKHEALRSFERQMCFDCFLCKFYKYCNGDCCQLKFDETGCGGLLLLYQYISEKR